MNKTFDWVTREGDVMAIDEMNTDHLYFTCRLIWNSIHGKKYRWDRGRISSFNTSIHTKDYRIKAYKHMIPELEGRPDLTVHQKRQLEKLKELRMEMLLDNTEAEL